MLAAQRFEVDRQNARIDGLVDRGEWTESPPTYDAYYDPSNNEVVFPAGILQPPLFDPAADDAVNYGAIGFLLGHELVHAFDDNGRHFDARATCASGGPRRTPRGSSSAPASSSLSTTWRWTPSAPRKNLADIGGLMVAYDAWRLSLQGKPAPAPIDGFTPEQRFFLAFANSLREKTRPKEQRMHAVNNAHSPERWRVNGAVGHLEAFARPSAAAKAIRWSVRRRSACGSGERPCDGVAAKRPGRRARDPAGSWSRRWPALRALQCPPLMLGLLR